MKRTFIVGTPMKLNMLLISRSHRSDGNLSGGNDSCSSNNFPDP
ncbi:MAG: hypothetical protein NTX82_06645 [Candidatus Parcubacteria bacterium]|nr:hypothetical protein [Candidatus Parcubacteria bacterium]